MALNADASAISGNTKLKVVVVVVVVVVVAVLVVCCCRTWYRFTDGWVAAAN